MKETLAELRKALIPKYGKGETEAIIRIIFHYLKGWNLTDILIHQEDELSVYMKQEIKKILERLLNDEPIQYITGEARFHGRNLKIAPGVLIPRQETEELVDIIIDENRHRTDLKVLDICTGSGCIAVSLALNLPFSKVTAIDFSDEAIEIAKANAKDAKVKIELIKEDVFEWAPTNIFDIIVSNPPYVLDREAIGMEKNVLNYEPHEAIFVRDDNPLVFYKRISEIALKCLSNDGKLYLEINPLTADELSIFLKKSGFVDISIIKDSFGKDRFISCKIS